MKRLLLLCTQLLVFLFSCTEKQEHQPTIPPVIRLGYQPAKEDAARKVKSLRNFADYLEKKLDRPIELFEVMGYASTIEAMKSDKIEITNLGSFGYVIAEEKMGVEPLVYKGHRDTGKGLYFSYLITANPEINSIQDIKENISNLKLTFGNPASTSGHLIPKKYFQQLGIDHHQFKEVLHSPHHVASLMAVLTRNVDIAPIQNTTIEQFVNSGKMDEDAIKILYKSAPIQTGPYIIRPNLPDEFKEKVKQALLDVCTEAPEIWADIRSSSNENLIFFPANKSLWNEIREMAMKTKQELFF